MAMAAAGLIASAWAVPASARAPAAKATPEEQQAARAAKQAAWAKAAETRTDFRRITIQSIGIVR